MTGHPEAVLADLRALISKAEAVVGNLEQNDCGCEGDGECEGDAGTLSERLDTAKDRVGEMCSNVRQRVVAGAKCTDKAIRDNPYTSLAITLGAGLLVGLLIGRHGSHGK